MVTPPAVGGHQGNPCAESRAVIDVPPPCPSLRSARPSERRRIAMRYRRGVRSIASSRSPPWERCSSSSASRFLRRRPARRRPERRVATGRVYLALGDSLAASFQPNGDTHSGYAEQVLQLEQARDPGSAARQARLSRRAHEHDRSTEAPVSVRRGHAARSGGRGAGEPGRCVRHAPDRLERHVPLLPVRAVAFDQACVDELLPKISARLTVRSSRRCGRPIPTCRSSARTTSIRCSWSGRSPGFAHDAAVAIADVWTAINDTLEQTYAALGVPVADIEEAFSTTDFDTIVHAAASATCRSTSRGCASGPTRAAERFDQTSTRTRSGTPP